MIYLETNLIFVIHRFIIRVKKSAFRFQDLLFFLDHIV